MEKIKYSLLIPNVGYTEYLYTCLKSASSQITSNTFEYEVILCDQSDLSDREKIQELISNEFSNIKLIFNEEKSVTKARHKLLSYASGDYFYFIDSDDFIDSDALLRIDNKMRNSGFPDILIVNLVTFFDSNKTKGNILIDEFVERNFLDYFLYTNTLNSLCIKIVKTSLYNLEDYDDFSNLNGEDFIMSYPLVKKSEKTICDKNLLIYHYRQHNNSRTKYLSYIDCFKLLPNFKTGVDYSNLNDLQKQLRLQTLLSFYSSSVQTMLINKAITKKQFFEYSFLLKKVIAKESLRFDNNPGKKYLFLFNKIVKTRFNFLWCVFMILRIKNKKRF